MPLKILLRQPLNFLKTLPFISKLEISFIIITLYAFISERLYYTLPKWQNNLSLSASETGFIISFTFILSLLSAGPVILRRLLPRQKLLSVFSAQPLKLVDLITVTAYFYFKYLFIIIVLFSPLFFVRILLYPLNGFYNLFIALFTAVIIFINYFFDLTMAEIKSKFYIKAFIYIIFYSALSFAGFYFFHGSMPFNLIFLILLSIMAVIKYKTAATFDINSIFTQNGRFLCGRKNRKINFNTIPRLFATKLQALFNKELITVWRNPVYRKIKGLTTAFYVGMLIFIILKGYQNTEILVLILSMFTVWLHYGNHFSDKYITPDPDWYFHTLPLKFYRVWFAKFSAEFIYILLLLTIQSAALFITAGDLQVVIAFDALFLLFSISALTVKLNFQILFYDTPRSAGYAYHFTLIFIVIMCYNYRLVGPLISLILISSYFIKSYRFFKG